MTASRVPSRYSNRLRRSLDQLKMDAEALDARVVVVEGSSGGFSVDYDTFDIDGTTSEDIAAPTDDNQVLIRVSNKVTAGGTHTLNFQTNDAQWPVGGGTASSIATHGAGSVLYAVSVTVGDVYRWYLMHSAGWA